MSRVQAYFYISKKLPGRPSKRKKIKKDHRCNPGLASRAAYKQLSGHVGQVAVSRVAYGGTEGVSTTEDPHNSALLPDAGSSQRSGTNGI